MAFRYGVGEKCAVVEGICSGSSSLEAQVARHVFGDLDHSVVKGRVPPFLEAYVVLQRRHQGDHGA